MLVQSTSAGPLRPGGAMVKFLLVLPVLVSVAALTLDGGRMVDERRTARAVADAAALAAAGVLYTNSQTTGGLDPFGTAKAAAVQVATASGYPASAVTVNIPPTSGQFAGRAGHAEVVIDSTVSATFGRAITGGDYPVAARAVARGEPLKIGVVALRSTGVGFNNTAAVFLMLNRPLVVNSSDPAALTSTGLTMLSLSRIDVTGGISTSSALTVTTQVRTGVRPTADPLATLPVPDTSAMTVRSGTALTINTIVPAVLQPGVYRGGIRVTGASVVVMSPGTYVMEGGGFRVDSLATVTGLGVTVYNSTGTAASGPISVNGLGKVILTAPASGTYQGVSFFQHRGLTQPVTLSGSGLTVITGLVYAMKGAVNLSGTAAVGLDTLGGAFVADSISVSGVGAVTVNLATPVRVPDVRLVE